MRIQFVLRKLVTVLICCFGQVSLICANLHCTVFQVNPNILKIFGQSFQVDVSLFFKALRLVS